MALNEVPLFIRSGKCIPVAEAAECIKDIDTEHLQLIGYKNSIYTMYEDDGIHKDYDKEENLSTVMKKDGQISGHPLKLHCFLIIIERKITKRKHY